MLPGKTEVLAVGAGPVGLTTALSLVARGRDVTIVDQQQQGANTSRASIVYSRTLAVLDPYGVAERLVAKGSLPNASQFTTVTGFSLQSRSIACPRHINSHCWCRKRLPNRF